MNAIAHLVARERTPEVQALWNKMVDDLAEYETALATKDLRAMFAAVNRCEKRATELHTLDPVAYEAWRMLQLSR